MQKKFPKLCHDATTGWHFAMIPDKSRASRRYRHYFSKDKKEAQKLYRATIAQILSDAKQNEAKQLNPASNWSLTDLADHYYEFKKISGTSAATLSQINRYLGSKSKGKYQLLPWLDRHGFNPRVNGAANLTTPLLSEYWRQLGDDSSIGRKEANHYISNVRALLRWGREYHGIALGAPIGPLRPFDARAKAGHGLVQDKTPLSVVEIKKLFSVSGVIDRVMILLGLNCGFGQTDIAKLRIDEVDFEKCKVCNIRPKTGVERTFKLWPETVAAMKIYLDKHRGKPVKPEHENLFFIGKRGLPVVWESLDAEGNLKRSDSVKNRFERLCDRAGIERRYGSGFYILRHSYGKLIADGSKDAAEVQAALGHSSIQMQLVYRHDKEEKAAAAQDRVRKALKSAIKIKK